MSINYNYYELLQRCLTKHSRNDIYIFFFTIRNPIKIQSDCIRTTNNSHISHLKKKSYLRLAQV